VISQMRLKPSKWPIAASVGECGEKREKTGILTSLFIIAA
jgi:hypothetical protein